MKYIPLRRRAPPLSPASGQPAAVIPAVIGWYFWASRPRRAKHKATHRSKLVNDTLEIKKCHQCNAMSVCRSKTILGCSKTFWAGTERFKNGLLQGYIFVLINYAWQILIEFEISVVIRLFFFQFQWNNFFRNLAFIKININ